GILPPPRRTDGGRRLYGSHEKRILAFIRRSRRLGFTITEIRALIALGAPSEASCDEVKEIATGHLKSVRERISDLQRLEAILADAVAQCEANTTPVCPVLDII